MTPWPNIHKWVVRYSDDRTPNLLELQNIIANESVGSLTENKNNVVHLASTGESSAVLKYLLEVAPSSLINQANIEGETPLHWAARCGSIENVKALVASGADPKIKDKQGNSVLHFAVESGNRDLVKYMLIKNLCGVNERNSDGNSPLAVACNEEEFKLITVLVKSGAETGAIIRQHVEMENKRTVKYLMRAKKVARSKTY